MKIKSAYFIVATALLVGCQQGEPTVVSSVPQAAPAPMVTASVAAMPGRVAVFDIDYVADQTGMMQSMKKKIEAKKEELKKDIEEFRKKLQAALKKEGKKLKKDKDLKKKAMALEQATELKFRRGQAEADAALNAYLMKLRSEVRDAIKPIARQVAYEKGFDVIMLRNEMIFDVKDEVELTNEILMAYQAKYPDAIKKPEPAAKPKAAAKGDNKKK